MGITVNDRVFYSDGQHRFFDLCNSYLFTGGSYYTVQNNGNPLQDRVLVVRHEEQLSCFFSCIKKASYLLFIPFILARFGAYLGCYYNNYQIREEGAPVPFVAAPLALNQNPVPQIEPQLLLNLKNYLNTHFGLNLFQIDNGGINYNCRLFDSTIVIQVQSLDPTLSERLSFKIDDQGQIHSIQHNGIDCGTLIPANKISWILAAIGQMESEQKENPISNTISSSSVPSVPHTSNVAEPSNITIQENHEITPSQLIVIQNYLKDRHHSSESPLVLFVYFMGFSLPRVYWYSNQVISIQLSSSFQYGNQDYKMSAKIDDQGNILSFRRDGVDAVLSNTDKFWFFKLFQDIETQTLSEIEAKEKDEKEGDSSIQKTAQGVSQVASQLTATELASSDILLLANNAGTQAKPIEFTYNEERFYLWLTEAGLFNIQLAKAFRSERVPNIDLLSKRYAQKLGVRVDQLTGQIQSVYFENNFVGNVIPSEQRNWIKAVANQIRTVKKDDLDPHFSENDLILFRQALNKSGHFQMKVKGEDYQVWSKQINNQFIINMQHTNDYNLMLQTNKLGLIIHKDTGQIISIQENGVSAKKIPEKFILQLQKAFKESMRLSSNYQLNDGVIKIEIVQRGLQSIPVFHLHSLTSLIKQAYTQGKTPTITVKFLEDQLVTSTGATAYGDGIDAGGLKRTYLDGIVTGLLESGAIEVLPNDSSLVLPKTKAEYDDTKPDRPPTCNHEEQSMYESLGVLMMYCHLSSSIPQVGQWIYSSCIGSHFNDVMFNVICNLGVPTVKTSFETLSAESRSEMHFQLSKTKDFEFGISKKVSKFLVNIDTETLIPSDKEEAIVYVKNSGLDTNDEDLTQIPILTKYLNRLLIATTEHGSLAPIHAVAKGMHSLKGDYYWMTSIHNKSHQILSEQIQGSIDRNKVASCFLISVTHGTAACQEISQKISWLKKWIVDEATAEELANLLRYFTGSSGLPIGKWITVRAQVNSFSPCPKAHTCNLVAEFSPKPVEFVSGKGVQDCPKERNTPQAFIEVLKKWVLSDPNSYGAA